MKYQNLGYNLLASITNHLNFKHINYKNLRFN